LAITSVIKRINLLDEAVVEKMKGYRCNPIANRKSFTFATSKMVLLKY